ncbi:nitrite reductase small subunit NirD [Georgenia wangjunii]|uniref:nitrite reductase small subunit NirD n=1 Tax=Georgenia wangjunii TaxID=3117730 RepID=UPI002F26CE2A
MTELLIEPARAARTIEWHRVCHLDDLEDAWGEVAWVGGEQVALFRLSPGEVHAVGHRDPATGSHVIARGITGSKVVAGAERATIASPLHKQVYDLATGECYTNPELHLRTYPTRVVDRCVEIGIAA